MHKYEIEIKSLLSGKEHADKLIEKMRALDDKFSFLGHEHHLNHYFIGSDLGRLAGNLKPHLSEDQKTWLDSIITRPIEHSVRTRQANDKVLIVLKISENDETSSNGVKRMEFESQMPIDLASLDKLVLDSGYSYQAKWSRTRDNYKYKGLAVTIDKNAGYGYLAEFEKLIEDLALFDQTKSEILEKMIELGAEELPQDRLERMFKHYNKNWQEYYGTDKTFVVN